MLFCDMQKAAYTKVGRFGKTHGVDGGIKLVVEDAFLDAVLEAEVLFAPVAGSPVPYFTEGVLMDQPLVMKLEDIDSKEDARELIGLDILLPESAVEGQLTIEDFRLLEGFAVLVEEVGEIGPILAIASYPEQIMALVQYGEKEVLIPLNETFLQAIYPEEQRVEMQLPEGLLDL